MSVFFLCECCCFCGHEEVLTFSLDGADFTRVSPALARHPGATARFLGRVCGLWSLATSVLKLGVAVIDSHILQWTRTEKKVESN